MFYMSQVVVCVAYDRKYIFVCDRVFIIVFNDIDF